MRDIGVNRSKNRVHRASRAHRQRVSPRSFTRVGRAFFARYHLQFRALETPCKIAFKRIEEEQKAASPDLAAGCSAPLHVTENPRIDELPECIERRVASPISDAQARVEQQHISRSPNRNALISHEKIFRRARSTCNLMSAADHEAKHKGGMFSDSEGKEN
jgi:hypothetical protein